MAASTGLYGKIVCHIILWKILFFLINFVFLVLMLFCLDGYFINIKIFILLFYSYFNSFDGLFIILIYIIAQITRCWGTIGFLYGQEQCTDVIVLSYCFIIIISYSVLRWYRILIHPFIHTKAQMLSAWYCNQVLGWIETWHWCYCAFIFYLVFIFQFWDCK